jgi:hypothetical protein
VKESTKKWLFGRRFYAIYRRMRFISYKKKARKLRAEQKLKIERKNKKQSDGKKSASIGFRIYRMVRIIRFLYKKSRQNRIIKKEKKKELKRLERIEQEEVRKRMKLVREQEREAKKEVKQKTKYEKKELKKKRRRVSRYIFKRRLRKFGRELKTFDINTVKRILRWFVAFAENKDKRNNFLIITTNSLVMFILSYFAVYIISQFIIIWVAMSFDYETILFYYKVYYNIDSGDWTADSVKILYSLAPLTGLLLGTVFITIYSTFKNERGILKLFFLWGFIHGMIMFFGALLMGTLLNKDFGWVIAYLYYRDTGKMIFSILAIFALVAIGRGVSKSFLISGNSYFNYVDKSNRKLLLFSQVLLPAIVGSAILILLKFPNDLYYGSLDQALFEGLKLSTIILVLLPVLFTFASFEAIYFDEEPRKIRLLWKFMIAAIVILFLWRLGLASGIEFS